MTDLPRTRRVALTMLAHWMGEQFFRTFRPADEDPGAFDAMLQQRERRVGVSIGLLWDDAEPVAGVADLEALLTEDMASRREAGGEGGYVVWVPPKVELPVDEPQRSDLRILLDRGLQHLEPGERREVRLPVVLKLAKIQADGAYVSVSGGLAGHWTHISEGVQGSFHLDSRPLHRLPEEAAELDIIVTRVRDRAALLEAEEVTDVQVHDHWLVSRLPKDDPPGVTFVAAPPAHDPQDGTLVRRYFRREVTRAVERKRAGQQGESGADLAVLVLVGALGHIGDELVTASLRGMNPATYGALDLIVLVADGRVRQVLRPRSLPWESQQA